MPSRSSDPSAAARSAAFTFSFQGDGMNLVASTRSSGATSVVANSRPMMRSLSPPP